MLALARKNAPSVRLRSGGMPPLHRAEQLNPSTGIFSAIGRLRSGGELRRVLRIFSRHLRPDGSGIAESGPIPRNTARARSGPRATGLQGSDHSEAWIVPPGNPPVLAAQHFLADHGPVRNSVEGHDRRRAGPSVARTAFGPAGFRELHRPSRFSGHRGIYVGVRSGPSARPSSMIPTATGPCRTVRPGPATPGSSSRPEGP